MAFVKKTWEDRISQYPNRRTINDGTTTKVVTVGRDEGNITQAGDAFNASNMNDLEDRIDNGLAEKPDREEVEDIVEGFFPLDEASGAMVSINPGVMLPLRYCECQINAYQASGTPTPDNPLPITGFSQANISVCGINLIQKQSGMQVLPLKSGTTIYFRLFNSSAAFSLYALEKGKVNISSNWESIGVFNGTTLQTVTVNKDYDSIGISASAYTTLGDGDIQVSLSPFDTFTAYNGNLYTVAFGQTICGGRLIYKDGEWSIEATHGIVDLGDLTWRIGYDVNRFIASDLIGMIQPPTDNDTVADIKCSIYSPISINNMVNNSPNNTIAVATSSNLSVLDTRYSSETDFKTAMNGITAVYELATPVIIPITSATRVKTIFGENNIYHDCNGDIDVIYHKALTAKNISFDNSGTTLTATNVEDAIKEVLGRI